LFNRGVVCYRHCRNLGVGVSDQFESLTREQLLQLLRQRERQKKLGLVWERNEIERDRALDDHFIALTLAPELCDGAAPWPNLVIEGDNFDALRWLRMTLRGQVKCILIDPPYNTGNKDWVYNDHYIDKEDAWRHSTWLEFLYQRLAIARDLLASDGVLLVTINDENRARLDLLMEEVLPGMRVGSMVWRTRVGSNADQLAFLSPDHEHVMVYAGADFRFAGNDKTFELYTNPDNDPNGPWSADNLTLGFSHLERPNLYYPLHDPKADIWYPANPDRIWVYASRARLKPGQRVQARPMEEFVERGQIRFPPDQRVEFWPTREALDAAIAAGDVPKSGRTPMLRPGLPDLDFWVGRRVGFGTPRFKRYKKDLRNPTQPLSSWITPRAEADTVVEGANMIVSGTNDEGAKVIKQVFGEKAFNYAKPVSLIRELVRQSTGPDGLVLDFFAGSATTAQAVMELNAADGGSRRFIMVSSTEASIDAPDRNICRDVTAERVRRLNRSEDAAFTALKAPFAYLRTREISFEDLDFELSVEEAWAALETFHGLPLTGWDPGASFAEHPGDDGVLLLVDRVTEAVLAAIRAHVAARTTLYLHAFAPGQLRTALEGLDVEVTGVRDALVKRFVA
jgi:adenine-specific DNA-methyltransferase